LSIAARRLRYSLGQRIESEVSMSEVLVRYVASVMGTDGVSYTPQACGAIAEDGLWEGWIEFVSDTGAIRTGRETEQPNRDDLMYWAQGLSAAYLEGAFARATSQPVVVPRREPIIPSVFEKPAPHPTPRPFKPQRAVLDPFTTYDQGEDLLRSQLAALSHDNLVAIVEDYDLGVAVPSSASNRVLIDSIVAAVRARTHAA
jgi:hypothetical protein